MFWDTKTHLDKVHEALGQLNVLPVRTMIKDGCTVDKLRDYIRSVFRNATLKTDEDKCGYSMCVVDDHVILYFRNITFMDGDDNWLSLTWRQCAKELMNMNKDKAPERIKWDEVTHLDRMTALMCEFLATAEEREKAAHTSYGDLTNIIRKNHKNDEWDTLDGKIRCYFDKVEIKLQGNNIIYQITWNKVAKTIHKAINGKGDGNMAIDFKAMKNARKAVEDSIPDTTSEGLAKTYSDVWGKDKENVIQIEVTRLVEFTDSEGNTQPYKLNPAKVAQIKASAEDVGIIEPLRVRRKGDIYEIISGHHRLAAAKELGHLTVPCLVGEFDDETAYKVLAESNIQRSVTLPSEYAKVFARYMKLREEKDMTVEEIGRKFDVSRKTVYRYVALSELTEQVQELVDTGIINIHAVELLKDLHISEQMLLCDVLTANKVRLSVPQAKKLKTAADEELLERKDIEKIVLGTDDKPVYKSKIYKTISEKHNITMTEKELDALTAKLLDEYFSKGDQL